MKINYKYDDIIGIDKIKYIYQCIYSSTRHKEKLIKFELYKTSNIVKIYNTLKNRHYNHLRYNIFIIKEPKYRIIMSELMYDKIINHLVSRYILIPFLTDKLIPQNVATREGMGSKEGIRYIKEYINTMKEKYDEIYVLKCDIKKYFYNIDHEILLKKLKRDIHDKDMLSITETIINSTDKEYINELIDRAIKREKDYLKKSNSKEYDKRCEELDKLPRYTPGKGLPIGNETSQILAIYYLNSLDHYIKEKLHIKYYVRYMDDFILLHHDRDYLSKCLVLINSKVKDLKLELNKKTQIYNLNKGFNFLGYKFKLKNKRLLVLLNNQTKKRIKRKLRKLKVKDINIYQKSLASYNGYFKVSTANNFIHKNKFSLKESRKLNENPRPV